VAECVIVDYEHGVATTFLNRPERLNALDLDTIVSLKKALQQLANNDEILAVVISGRGKAFCAGGDLAWVAQFPGGRRAALLTLAGEFHQAIMEIREMRKPVIAAIDGVAAGGGFSLALACDFRVLNRDATLRHAYASAGLSMDGGASFMLPKLVGYGRALEIAAFDAPLNADLAVSMGLATEVTDGSALQAAVALARRMSDGAVTSFGWSKQLLNASYESALEAQLLRELQGIVECAGSPEGLEGVTAFIEKRRPNFMDARARAGRGE
jgi:2-(1,2-epoxy-1,2-dihydrophenyl)acetyl-CoA isomerase